MVAVLMMVLVGVKSTVTTLPAALKSMKPWCVNMQLMALTWLLTWTRLQYANFAIKPKDAKTGNEDRSYTL